MNLYFKQDGVEIYQGDCLRILPQLPDKSIDMILCDPPYGKISSKWDTVIPLEKLWAEYERVLKNKGSVVALFGNQPFTSKLVLSKEAWFRHHWIWDKRRPSGFQISKHRPLYRHEEICVFSKDTPNYYPIMIEKSKPSIARASQSESSPLSHSDRKYRQQTHAFPQSILVFNKERKSLHPTQKPVELCEYLIRTYSKPGEVILDNCLGSGTTAVAAIKTGRKCIGIEIEEKYAQLSKERVLAELQKNSMKLITTAEVEKLLFRRLIE